MSNKRIFCDGLRYNSWDYQYWSPNGRLQDPTLDVGLKCQTCKKKVVREGNCEKCSIERLRTHFSPAKE